MLNLFPPPHRPAGADFMPYREIFSFFVQISPPFVRHAAASLLPSRKFRKLNQLVNSLYTQCSTLYAEKEQKEEDATSDMGNDILSVLCEYLSYDELIIETLIGFRSTQPEIK